MRGLACLFLFALASPFLAGLFSVLIGPLLVVLLVLGLPAVFWHRWRTGPVQVTPTSEGLNTRERLAFYAVRGNRSAQQFLDALDGREP